MQDGREDWGADTCLVVAIVLRIFKVLTLDEKSNQIYVSRVGKMVKV